MLRTTLISFLFICPLFTMAQTDRFSAKSVVKIKTSYIGQDREGNSAKVINTSSGWTWNDPLWVVTTLHSVAGVENIEVCSTTKNCANAKIVRVLKEADLALLRIELDGAGELCRIARPQSLINRRVRQVRVKARRLPTQLGRRMGVGV